MSRMTKVFEKTPQGYHFQVLTPKKDVDWKGIQLNVPFTGEYIDGSQHQIVVTYDPARDVLTERHTEIGKGTTDVYQYSVQNGFLVMRMEYKGVVTNRYYKRQ
ncbi:LBP-3 protein [Aphelenchoides avenae]|nr:LBP-3 protein [Aphelenchus avenae]